MTVGFQLVNHALGDSLQLDSITIMAQKIKGNARLGNFLRKNDINPSALKSKTGRKVRSDIKISTLRKRSEKSK